MEIKLYGWMINELNLSRTELLVFATVFSMRQDGWFKVSRKEIHRWVRISPRQISRIIQNLSNIGIIEHRVLCDDETGCYAEFKIPEYINQIAEKFTPTE